MLFVFLLLRPNDVTAKLPIAQIAAHPRWRDQLELLLDCTGEGIYGVDLEGRCIFINRAGADMLGYPAADLLGRNMHDVMHHSRPDGSRYPVEECPIFNAFRQGRPCRLEDDVLWRADGGSFCAEYSSYPILDQGEITGAVVTFVDITGRKHAQEMLRRAHDELESRVAERTQELTAAVAELGRSHARLRELSTHLQTVREEERTRIAREVHDELGSVLAALKMDVGWLRHRIGHDATLAQKAIAMGKLIDSAIVEVGRIITDLRPSILDHQGLWAALEWHVQEFLQATGLRGKLELNIEPQAPTPRDVLATAAYRIFQEILNNVARHASATAVHMQVNADVQALTIKVRDNGRGVTLEQLRRAKSHGVLGMSERARHFGGKLEIGPIRGGGTLVRVWLPLTGHAEPNDDPVVDL
jgi:PAS domain S-box-containing protein